MRESRLWGYETSMMISGETMESKKDATPFGEMRANDAMLKCADRVGVDMVLP